MKKINLLLVFSIIGASALFTTNVFSQELRVASGGSLYVNSKGFVAVGDINVDAGGSVSLTSDATNSSSLLVSGTATGDVTYERYVSDANWHLFSAPVTSQSISAFATNSSNSIRTNDTKYAIGLYNNTNIAGAKWEYFNISDVSEAGSFTSGKGYTFSRAAAGVFSFTGNLALADVVLPINTASGTDYWHSVGNPFSSFLPANDNAAGTNLLGQNLTALDPSFGALYFYDGASYVPINQLSASYQLAPGQAFLVRAKDDTENFTFTKSLANHQSGTTTLYRGLRMAGINLQLKDNNAVVKTASVKFLANATLGLDVGYDAGAYQEGTPSFAINTHLVADSKNIDFTLQVLPDNSYEGMVIPISVYAASGKTISIQAIGDGLPAEINLFIEDKQLSTFTKVDDVTGYEVTLSEALSGVGRFYLHTTTSSVLATDDVALSGINMFTAEDNILKISGINTGEQANVILYSLLGKEVFSSAFLVNGTKDILLPNTLSTGVYISKLNVAANQVLTKKIIIQ